MNETDQLVQIKSSAFEQLASECRPRVSGWEVYLSPTAPCTFNGGLETAKWMEEGPLRKKGIYLWLIQPRPDKTSYRFLHVGISWGRTSSLRLRTEKHCENLFADECSKDGFHELAGFDPDSNDFGTLGVNLRDKFESDAEQRLGAAKEYLEKIRVLYIVAPDVDHDERASAIKGLEGMIGRSAHALLTRHKSSTSGRSDETTNTLSRLARWDVTTDSAVRVAKVLNKLAKMLPERPWPTQGGA